ncbi:MAG: prolipoprotein diacylglyceryl transferase [Terrimicrobiaceae bacterium]
MNIETTASSGESFPLMLAYYIHDLSPFVLRFSENYGVRWYGLAYVAAFFIGILIVRRLSQLGYCDIPPQKVSDFIIGGAIFGVLLGGRLGYMLFYDLQNFLSNPLIFFRVMDGGMSAHGGILGLTLYTLWYSFRHKVSWRNIGDNLVVAAPLGLFLGRLANFINGELYGRVASVPWAVQFPKELYEAPPETVQLALSEAATINPEWISVEDVVENVRHSTGLKAQLAGTLSPRHPSQLYEAALEGLVLFAILWVLRTRFHLRNGVLTGFFFAGYAILRMIGELFREPDAPLTGPFTRGQFLSLFLLLISLGFFVSAWLRPDFPVSRRRK